MVDHEKQIKQIMSLMENLLNDSSIPKNIRKNVKEAKDRLSTTDEPVVRASGAVYALSEVSEDINMPIHARTQIWTILSALETIRET
ncbi:MAG: UPF0147 family protein [Candidatus Micrarchaeota archaeon]